jgi:hypothetical protein
MERQAVPKVEKARGNSQSQRQSAQSTSAGHSLLKLQGSLGNQALQRVIDSPYIQAKLQISTPGDPFEQQADHVAEQVMRMPESKIQRACACGDTCSKCEAGQKHQLLQTKRVGASESGPITAPPIVHQGLASPGQPLDVATRAFFEPRFGQDFSRVRVHSDATAEQSARAVSANAFTVGQNIVFGPSRFAPNTDEGRRLLAHELTHVVQQSGVPSQANMVQRDLGFEFQVDKNTLTTNLGQKFGVKSGKFFHRVPKDDDHGLELQTDTGGDLEFQTQHFQKWSDLQTQIQNAVKIVNGINNDPKAFPFNQESRLRSEGLLKKGEKLEVNVQDPTFVAYIQSTEGVALDQYQSLLNEHERESPKYIDPVIRDAQSILNTAAAASKSIKPGVNLDNLRGFLQMIINYIRRGQGVLWDKTSAEPVKATFGLMARTDFSSAFRDLLSADEQTLFKDIVKSNAIQTAVGIAPNDPFFPTGYWGHPPGNSTYMFLEGGKVTAVAPETKTPIHDCSSKTKTPGVDSSNCGRKFPDSVITVGGWLESIIKQKKDQLSPVAHGSASMGKMPVESKGTEKGLVKIETRGYRTRNRVRPASQWVEFAEDIFSMAAVCRRRPGAATDLIYDARKPVPKNCP